ncbi:hypothetical protein AAHH80_33935, partial [Burkholderia pseudomallei]
HGSGRAGIARSAAIGRRKRQECFPIGEQGGLQQHNASSFMESESRDPFILFLFTVSRFDDQCKIQKQTRK